MKDFLIKTKRFLPQIVLAMLIAIFFIANPRTEKILQTALLNPKYDVDKITLSYSKEGSCVLVRCGSFWTCDYTSPQENIATFPCDSTVIKNLLDNARKIIKLYEISDNLKAKEAFGLSDQDSFTMEFCCGGKTVSKLHFGASDSMHRIALYAVGSNQKIYSTDGPILTYLTASPDFWCDPYIFPQNVCGDLQGAVAKVYGISTESKLSAEEIARFRHGRLYFGDDVPSESKNNVSHIEIDDGKGNRYLARFAPTNDDEGSYYYYFEALTPSATRSEEEKTVLARLNYVATISAWTYNQLFPPPNRTSR